jgi:hypothetical protein
MRRSLPRALACFLRPLSGMLDLIAFRLGFFRKTTGRMLAGG